MLKNLQGHIWNKQRNSCPRIVILFKNGLMRSIVFFHMGLDYRKNHCCYEDEYSSASNVLVHTNQQQISETQLKHIDKGDSIVNLRT